MFRVYRVFHIAVAVTFISALTFVLSARAAPGDCPAFKAADIDTCFNDWADAEGLTAFDSVIHITDCADDPARPFIRMTAMIPVPGRGGGCGRVHGGGF